MTNENAQWLRNFEDDGSPEYCIKLLLLYLFVGNALLWGIIILERI